MSSIQATRLKKGMLIKIGADLFRVLELQHVTPGNLRGFVRAKFRNIRNGALADQKLRSEDTVERAMLDEREMQYLYRDGDSFHFMDTDSYEQLHISEEVLGDSVNYLMPEAIIKVEFYGERAGRHRAAADGRPEGRGHRARHQGRDRQRPGQAGAARDRPGRQGAAVREHRRHGPREHRDRRIPVAGPESADRELNRADGRHPDTPRPRLDRSHHRQHVQRQERGADPPAAPRADRAAQGADLQADDRQPLRRRPHHLAQRHAHRRRRTSSSSRELLERVRPDTEVVGIDEGQFFDAELPAVCSTLADQGKRVHRRRPRPGLSRQAVRADAAAAGDRRIHHQDAGDLHGLRRARQPHAAAGRQQRAGAGRRAGHLRGALPAAASIRGSGSRSEHRSSASHCRLPIPERSDANPRRRSRVRFCELRLRIGRWESLGSGAWNLAI